MNWIVYGLIGLVIFAGIGFFSSLLPEPSEDLELHEEFLVRGRNTCQSSVSYIRSEGLEPPISVQPPEFSADLVGKDGVTGRYSSVIQYTIQGRESLVLLSEPSRIFPTTPVLLYLHDFHQSPTSKETQAIVDEMVQRGFIVVVPEVPADPYLIDSTNYYLSISAQSYERFVTEDLLFLLSYLQSEYSSDSSLIVYGKGWGALLGAVLVSNSSYPSGLLVSLPVVDPNRYYLEGGPVTFLPGSPFSRAYFGERAVSFKCSAGYLSYFTYLEDTPLFLLESKSGNGLQSLSRVLEDKVCVRAVPDLRRAVERWAEGVDCLS